MLIRESFAVGPLACNCSIIGDPVTRHALVVDPGGDADLIIERLAALQLQPVQLVHTHAHLDHFLAADILRQHFQIPALLHHADLFLWHALEFQCQMMRIPLVKIADPSGWLVDDQVLAVGNGICLHTPGHTPGSISFWFEDEALLLSGDTLFQDSIGRTDLPGGDFKQIQRSIRERLYVLNDNAIVIPGHGPQTTIGHEKAHNGFVRA